MAANDKETPTPNTPPNRTWREIAWQITHEPDRSRIPKLSQELFAAFNEELKTRQASAIPFRHELH